MSSVWSSAHIEVRVSPGFHIDGRVRVGTWSKTNKTLSSCDYCAYSERFSVKAKPRMAGADAVRVGRPDGVQHDVWREAVFGDPRPPALPLMNSLKGI